MITSLGDYLTGMAIGIRFRANFSIEDQIGKIADNLLYSKDSFFSPEKFSQVQNMVGSKKMFNPATTDRLQIDNSNIVLDYNFAESGPFKKSESELILREFNRQIVKGVLSEFKIREIMRVGIVHRYIFPIEELARIFVSKTIGQTLEGVNDISLSFSKRIATGDALVKRAVSDYDNVIFNIIKKADLPEIFMAVDYQSFFEPFLPNSNEIDFDRFTTRAKAFNSGKYVAWLNANYSEE